MFLILNSIDDIGLRFIIGIIFYLYFGYCLMILSKKNGTPGGAWAFAPIFNLFILIGCAKKPYWFFILFLIPLVNIVVMIYIWMEIAKIRKHPYWLGILIILPIADLILPGYLAFIDKEQTVLPQQSVAPQQSTQPQPPPPPMPLQPPQQPQQ